jgi:hypothetical protein
MRELEIFRRDSKTTRISPDADDELLFQHHPPVREFEALEFG